VQPAGYRIAGVIGAPVIPTEIRQPSRAYPGILPRADRLDTWANVYAYFVARGSPHKRGQSFRKSSFPSTLQAFQVHSVKAGWRSCGMSSARTAPGPTLRFSSPPTTGSTIAPCNSVAVLEKDATPSMAAHATNLTGVI